MNTSIVRRFNIWTVVMKNILVTCCTDFMHFHIKWPFFKGLASQELSLRAAFYGVMSVPFVFFSMSNSGSTTQLALTTVQRLLEKSLV